MAVSNASLPVKIRQKVECTIKAFKPLLHIFYCGLDAGIVGDVESDPLNIDSFDTFLTQRCLQFIYGDFDAIFVPATDQIGERFLPSFRGAREIRCE